jgi:hypothetical protein
MANLYNSIKSHKKNYNINPLLPKGYIITPVAWHSHSDAAQKGKITEHHNIPQ